MGIKLSEQRHRDSRFSGSLFRDGNFAEQQHFGVKARPAISAVNLYPTTLALTYRCSGKGKYWCK